MIKIYVENQKHECAIEKSKLRFVSYAYAHGDLAHEAGFDLIRESKNEHFDKRKNVNGEECIAVLPNGREVEALFFFWKAIRVYIHEDHWGEKYRQVWVQPRGLLVALTDFKSIVFAR